jgi:oligoendopeptidase F
LFVEFLFVEFRPASDLANALTLGKRFGVDVQSVEFWRSSLEIIRKQIAKFEEQVSA